MSIPSEVMAAIQNDEYALEAVDSLVLHPQNKRRGDVPRIMESIRVNGFVGALIVLRRTREELAGNHRLLAARELGMAEVPVLWVEVDDETAVNILLADNATADAAEWERPGLASLLTDLEERRGTLAGTGFSRPELDKLIDQLNTEGDVALGEPVTAKPASVRDGFEGRCPRCGYPDDTPA